jgi:large repetitive protein
MSRTTTCVIAACLAVALGAESQSAVMYSGGTYTQDFNTLPSTPRNTSLGDSPAGWTDDNAAPATGNFSIPGWYIWHPIASNAEAGFNGHQRFRVSGTPTTAATGSYYAFGDAASTERALGVVPSGTIAPNNGEVYYGMRLTNNTGNTLQQFTVDYAAEQWRVAADVGGRPAGNQSVTLDYRLGGTDLQSGTFTEIPGGGFDSIFDASAAGTHLNGNDAANRLTGRGATVTGLNWEPGQDLWVRWTQLNIFSDAGEIADHGLAIDDLRFAANVPEPATFVLAAVAAMGLIARRR